MILILGVWVYNDIFLRPIFRKMFPRSSNQDKPQDRETNHGVSYDESYELPVATKNTNSGKTEESMTIRKMSNFANENIQGL